MNTKRPIIGLTPQLDITNPFRHVRLFPQYQRAIEKAGGIGIMLPLTRDKDVMKEMTQMCDGFIFTGGQDLAPYLYGEEESDRLSMSTGYAPERDEFESAFYPIAFETKKPILAICRGFQIINVLHGGTINQDLPEYSDDPNFVLHPAWSEEHGDFHDILIRPDTQLKNIFKKDDIQVNSFHHQGLDKIGTDLTVSGVARDGLVEAFDINGLDFGVGVQWHPEVMFDEGIGNGELFLEHIKACYEHRNQMLKSPDPRSFYFTA